MEGPNETAININSTMYDDDKHICLRCHTTIFGLDNYVTHRHAGCVPITSSAPAPTTVEPQFGEQGNGQIYLSETARDRGTESMNSLWDTDLRADDFFSVLELQRLQASPSESRKRLRSEARQFMDPHLSITELWYDTVEHEELMEEFNDNEFGRLNLSPICTSKYLRASPDLRARSGSENFTVAGLSTYCTESRSPRLPRFRGKWMPGEEKDLVRDEETYCSYCDRSHSSQRLYEKHLLSSEHLEKVRVVERRLSPRKKSTVPDFAHLHCSARKPRKGDIVCSICHARVAKHLFGKHLLSRYHYEFGRRKPSANAKLIFKNFDKVVKECVYQCAMCKFYCNSDIDFLRHWRSVDHKKKDIEVSGLYVCSACNFEAGYAEFSAHLMSRGHEERASIVFQCVPIVIRKRQEILCNFCPRAFDLRVKLRRHVRKIHAKDQTGATPQSQPRVAPARDVDHSYALDSEDESSQSNLLLVCPECPSTFSTYEVLSGHVREEHKDYFVCSECSFYTLQPTKLRRHIQEVHEIHPGFQCWICKLSFHTKEEADHHRESREHRERAASLKKGAVILKKCAHCRQVFRDLPSLRDHVITQHPDEMAKCERCSKKFAFKQDLAPHRKTCLGVTLDQSSSGTSVVIDVNVDPIEVAVESCDEGNMYRFSCSMCQASYAEKAEEMFHTIMTHIGPASNRTTVNELGVPQIQDMYKCTECHLLLAKDSLKRHLYVHSEDRTFKCKYCQIRLRTESQLEAHVATHNIMSCVFDGCNFMTVHPSSLSRHVEKHEANRKFPCPQCDRHFKTDSALQSHVLVHTTNQKVFRCNQCDYSTIRKGTLNRHLSYVHSVGTPAICEFCGFRAKNNHHLKRHEKNSH